MFKTLKNNIAPAELIRAGRLMEATAAIQRALGGSAAAAQTLDARSRGAPPTIDGTDELRRATTRRRPGERSQDFLGKVNLRDLVRTKFRGPSTTVQVPQGAQFLTGTFANEAGSRPYKLYVPSSYHAGQRIPLVVMLHGCTQSPNDFALGTRMNEIAERRSLLVVYPAQVGSANIQKCWNWFKDADQRRDRGEPSLIAGITREVVADYAVDPRCVFVAGLSAGGAAAAIMGATYPDLYAAIGVHSGLPIGAAHDVPSAFQAMRQGAVGSAPERQQSLVPAIVFHGDRDTTVSPQNGDAVAAQSAAGAKLTSRTEHGTSPGGRSYTRTVRADAKGRSVVEQWVVHGAAHAWSGGNPEGSYTDPQGPDASAEMVRFFMQSATASERVFTGIALPKP